MLSKVHSVVEFFGFAFFPFLHSALDGVISHFYNI